MLILILIIAICMQFLLFKVSRFLKSQYGLKFMMLLTFINIMADIRLYILSFGNITLKSFDLTPTFIWQIISASKNILPLINVLLIALAMSVILASTAIDFRYKTIPDTYNIAIAGLGIIRIINNRASGIWSPIACAIVLLVAFFLLSILTNSIGMGDAKMSAATGLLFGLSNIMNFLVISFVTGAIVAIILLITKKKKITDKIAFGPYLGFGAIMVFLQAINLFYI